MCFNITMRTRRWKLAEPFAPTRTTSSVVAFCSTCKQVHASSHRLQPAKLCLFGGVNVMGDRNFFYVTGTLVRMSLNMHSYFKHPMVLSSAYNYLYCDFEDIQDRLCDFTNAEIYKDTWNLVMGLDHTLDDDKFGEITIYLCSSRLSVCFLFFFAFHSRSGWVLRNGADRTPTFLQRCHLHPVHENRLQVHAFFLQVFGRRHSEHRRHFNE